MTDKDRQCKNCMYYLEIEKRLGWCMFNPPQPVPVEFKNCGPTPHIASRPLVREFEFCSKFEPREFPCVHYCFESNQQENDK